MLIFLFLLNDMRGKQHRNMFASDIISCESNYLIKYNYFVIVQNLRYF